MMWRRKEQDLTKICKGYRITAAAEKKVMKRHRAVRWMTVWMLLKVSRIRLICTGLPKILSQVQTAAAEAAVRTGYHQLQGDREAEMPNRLSG